MIHYKESYMTPNIADYEKIADFLNIDVEDQEVWCQIQKITQKKNG